MKEMVGRPLDRVLALKHVLAGVENDKAIEFCLVFRDEAPLRLHGGPAGERLLVDENLPQEMDMGEDGECVLRDMSSDRVCSHLVGKPLAAVWGVTSQESGKLVGMRFELEGGGELVVCNLDDQLYMYDCMPEALGTAKVEKLA